MSVDIVPQGTSYTFSFSLSGDQASDFTYRLQAKQYPDDTASINRVVSIGNNGTVTATLTPAETADLDIGLWYLTIEAIDTDEEIHASKRIQISRNWV